METVSTLLQALNDVRKESLDETFEELLSQLKAQIKVSPFKETYNLQPEAKYKDYFLMRFKESGMEVEVVWSYTGSFNSFNVKVPVTFPVKVAEPEPEEEKKEEEEEKKEEDKEEEKEEEEKDE